MKIPVKLINLLVNATLAVLRALRLDTPNRIVVVLSPVFVSLSGAILTLSARYFPLIGHRLTRGQLVGVFIAGALIGSTKLLLWLHGWQQHESTVINAAINKPGSVGANALKQIGLGATGPETAATTTAPAQTPIHEIGQP